MELNYIVELYDPMTSHWYKCARLPFMPDEFLAERIADECAKEMYTCYSKLRIKNGRTILKELEF